LYVETGIPEFRREVQHSSALSLLDFPFPGAAFASRNAAEGGGEGRKIRSFLGEPERPKVLHFASESTPDDVREQYEAAKGRANERMRVVCDFVAGMTDRYAIEFYGRLHSDSAQSMFKPI